MGYCVTDNTKDDECGGLQLWERFGMRRCGPGASQSQVCTKGSKTKVIKHPWNIQSVADYASERTPAWPLLPTLVPPIKFLTNLKIKTINSIYLSIFGPTHCPCSKCHYWIYLSSDNGSQKTMIKGSYLNDCICFITCV